MMFFEREFCVTTDQRSAYRELRSFSTDAVQWTDGFWADRFSVCQKAMIPNMWRLLRDPEISHAYTNFLIAAGFEDGHHAGPRWHDGDFYKWLEAAAHVYSITRDQTLDQLMDEVIAVIGQCQREDGYIHTPVIIQERLGTDTSAFQERLDFETYNMGHLMTAACVHNRATGKPTLMRIAQRAADFLYNFYKTAAPELARNAICPSHYIGIVDMYRSTGEPRYLELACNLVEIRDLVTNGSDDNQDRVPFRQQDRAVGHAVRANYLYAGVADIYMETGDRTLLDTLETLWQSVASTKLHVTGGCGALYDGASPDGAVAQETITRVHQAYGREYQLPNVTAHNETCANIGNALWNWRMLSITGEARFADMLELVLYNSALVGISLDGARFFYTNTLRQIDGIPFELRWNRSREAYISCFCCPPNIVRTIAQVGSYVYSVSDDGIWVHLYGGNTAKLQLSDGTPVQLTQTTAYPWEGEINLTVDTPSQVAFSIMLRVPGWCPRASLTLNGEVVYCDMESGQYAKVNRRWSPGDTLTLTLDMPAQRLESHPLVEETSNHLAIRRGPLIYALESIDLPEGVRIGDVMLSRVSDLQPVYDPSFDGLIGDIRALRGKAAVVSEARWHGALYRPAQPRQLREIDIQFIPYFAWDNRGKSEMTVWMPEAQPIGDVQ